MLRERDAGRIAHLGNTETAPNDHEHVALTRAIESGLFDVVMVAGIRTRATACFR